MDGTSPCSSHIGQRAPGVQDAHCCCCFHHWFWCRSHEQALQPASMRDGLGWSGCDALRLAGSTWRAHAPQGGREHSRGGGTQLYVHNAQYTVHWIASHWCRCAVFKHTSIMHFGEHAHQVLDHHTCIPRSVPGLLACPSMTTCIVIFVVVAHTCHNHVRLPDLMLTSSLQSCSSSASRSAYIRQSHKLPS